MGPNMGRRETALFAVALAAWFAAGAPYVVASTIGVTPVNLTLGRDAASTMLSISNQGKENVSFTLATYAWSQGPSGKIQLAPTSDIIFFPAFLTIGPGESASVRIGTEMTSTTLEKTYRIILDELPPPRTSDSSRAGMQIRVLSQISIPIFIEPDDKRVQMQLEDATTRNGGLALSIRNTGSVHVAPDVTVAGTDAAGAALFTLGPQHVWYILAQGTRPLDVPLPKASCTKVRSLLITARSDTVVVKKTVLTPSGACAP
jgi:fimbrial chaperone protein